MARSNPPPCQPVMEAPFARDPRRAFDDTTTVCGYQVRTFTLLPDDPLGFQGWAVEKSKIVVTFIYAPYDALASPSFVCLYDPAEVAAHESYAALHEHACFEIERGYTEARSRE